MVKQTGKVYLVLHYIILHSSPNHFDLFIKNNCYNIVRKFMKSHIAQKQNVS